MRRSETKHHFASPDPLRNAISNPNLPRPDHTSNATAVSQNCHRAAPPDTMRLASCCPAAQLREQGQGCDRGSSVYVRTVYLLRRYLPALFSPGPQPFAAPLPFQRPQKGTCSLSCPLVDRRDQADAGCWAGRQKPLASPGRDKAVAVAHWAISSTVGRSPSLRVISTWSCIWEMNVSHPLSQETAIRGECAPPEPVLLPICT